MPLTVDQVLALAPDASSASAGRKLGTPRDWRNLGVNDVALWGDCQGSALYGVQIDLSDHTSKCSCPSRKFPCKHALGLLLLHAGGQVPAASDTPERVATWLTGRAERAAKKAEVKEVTPEQVAKKAARAEARLGDMGDAVAPFALWLDDVARAGIGSLQQRSGRSLAHEAARLVDVGAPGLAARVRDVAEDVGRGAGWEEAALAGLGELRLVTHALTRLDALPDALRTDLRTVVGVPIAADEVRQQGPRDTRTWVVAGVHTHTDPTGLRARRTWLVAADDPHTHAVQLDFAPGAMPLPAGPAPGQAFTGTIARWPGASGQRALVLDRADVDHIVPRGAMLAAALDAASHAFARAPLQHAVLLVLADVTVGLGPAGAYARDATGSGLPLPALPELLLATAGSAPVTLAGVWDGHCLVPLTAWLGSRVLVLDAAQPVARRSPALRLLTQHALLGGDGPLPSTPVDAVVPDVGRAPRLLLVAGALDAWARAGTRAHPVQPVADCPDDPAPPAPDGVRDVLAMVDSATPHAVAVEVYRRLTQRGLRLPDAELPATLTRAHGDVVRPLLGARGHWLAALAPARWSWAIAAPGDDVESIASAPARRAALRALRDTDPEDARVVLGRLLATEKADRRAELVEDLLGAATTADLPVLATLDNDRSAVVRERVDAVRLSLGVDPHADIVRRRLELSIRAAPPSGLAWIASKVTGGGGTLSVDLPPGEDPTWEADGLPTLPHAPGKPVLGLDRLVWLLRRVPPAEHTARTGLSPTAFLAALPADMPELVRAVAEAAARTHDVAWIDALDADARAAGRRAELLGALPREQLHARLLAALRSPTASYDLLLDVWGPGILPLDVATALAARIRAAHSAAPSVASAHSQDAWLAHYALRHARLLDVPDALLASVADLLPDTPSVRTHHAARLHLAALLPEP